jgi:two-component system sensor histidine kinase KdpD
VVHVAPNLARVNANFDFLEQAMFNIIDNAGKYSPSHSVIEIVAHAEGDDIVIRIFDRGPGISDELAKIMFNKFARAAQGDSKSPGTGLGLAIASGFIRAMGGTVTGKNRSVGQGAVFTIKLPTYQPATVPTLCD